MNTKWADDNPYLAAAIVMFLLGSLAGFGKVIIQNPTLDFGKAASASIFMAFLLACLAVWEHNGKKDMDD